MTFSIIRHLIEGDDASMMSFTASGGVERTLADTFGERVNVRDYGAKGDGVTDDSAAIVLAFAKGASAPAPHLYFPPGEYVVNSTVQMNYLPPTGAGINMVIFGPGAVILFKGAAQWKFGDDADISSLIKLEGLDFALDAGSTAVAPISLYNVGRITFVECHWRSIVTSGIDQRSGVVILRGCNPSMATGAVSFIHAAYPSGGGGAIFIQGGRYDGKTGMTVVDHSGAGQLDGMVFSGVTVSGFGHALVSAPASGGHLSNMLATGCMFDAVDQEAFKFAPAAGAALNDVSIIGNKLNGSGSSTKTSGALISVDLTSGATHGKPFVVKANTMDGAQVRAFEVLGGTFGTVVFTDNTITDYGRENLAASRAAYIAGTFDLLVVAETTGTTTWTHDHDIEFGAYTATQKRIANNLFGGTAANSASIFGA